MLVWSLGNVWGSRKSAELFFCRVKVEEIPTLGIWIVALIQASKPHPLKHGVTSSSSVLRRQRKIIYHYHFTFGVPHTIGSTVSSLKFQQELN